MKKYSKVIYGVIGLLGLLVLIFPSFWVKLVVFSVGLCSIFYGIYNLLITRRIFQDSMYETAVTAKALFSIIIGALAVILPLAFAETMWKVMVYIQVIYLLIDAGIGFYSVSLLKSTEINRRPYIFENLFLVLIAVILFLISPEKLGLFLIRVVGLVGFVAGIFMLVMDILFSRNAEEVEVKPEDIEIKDN